MVELVTNRLVVLKDLVEMEFDSEISKIGMDIDLSTQYVIMKFEFFLKETPYAVKISLVAKELKTEADQDKVTGYSELWNVANRCVIVSSIIGEEDNVVESSIIELKSEFERLKEMYSGE